MANQLPSEFKLAFLSESPEATDALAEHIGRQLSQGALLTLDGDLGAGKTLFVKGLARGLDVQEHVDSPTYTLMNEYEGRCRVYHCDAWMQGREEAFLRDGGEDCLNGDGVTVIEWGSRVAEMLPRPHLRIELSHRSVSARRIEMEVVSLDPAETDGPSAQYSNLQNDLSIACIHQDLSLESSPKTS